MPQYYFLEGEDWPSAEIWYNNKTLSSGFPPYLENFINLDFGHFLFHDWKMPGICSKSGKTLEFEHKTWKKKPWNYMFQTSLFKMSFTKIILIYFFVISTLSIQTLIRSQIGFEFHCFYLEITWKIHGMLCHKRSRNHVSWPSLHFLLWIVKWSSGYIIGLVMCIKWIVWKFASLIHNEMWMCKIVGIICGNHWVWLGYHFD